MIFSSFSHWKYGHCCISTMDIVCPYRAILIPLQKTGVFWGKFYAPRLYTGSFLRPFLSCICKFFTTMTEKSVTLTAKLVGWPVGWIVEEKMAAYATTQPPLIALLLVRGPLSYGTWLVGSRSRHHHQGHVGAGGQGGRGGQKLIAVTLHSLPPGRQMCAMWGKLMAVTTMAAPSPPLLPLQGLPPVASRWAIAARKERWCGGGFFCGGWSQQHPHASRGATAAATAIAFLQEWASLFVGKEEFAATTAAAMCLSWQWWERVANGLTRAGREKKRRWWQGSGNAAT
jgi:hypothetical protein